MENFILKLEDLLLTDEDNGDIGNSLFGSMSDRMINIFQDSKKEKFWLVSSNDQYRNHDFAWEELAFHIGLFFIQNSSELENFSSGIYQDWDEKFDATVRRNSPPMGNTSDSRRKGVAHDSIPPIGKGNASIMG